jgi:hypothetical protein
MDVRDLDDDRDLDLISIGVIGGTVTIGRNDGSGQFDVDPAIPVGSNPVTVRTDDLDRDGFPDIVTANLGDDTVSVILNEGGTQFAPAVNLPVGGQPRSITTIDIEGDGDLDVAVVADDDMGTRVVQVLRNDQVAVGDPLVFADADEFDVGEDPVFVLSGDLDQDSDADLIAVNGDLGDASPLDGPPPAAVNARLNAEILPCLGDLNDSGAVGFDDILVLIGAWGPCPPDCPEDLNGNGAVDFADILAVVGAWGPCP